MRDSRHEVLHFWFEEIEPVQWFQNNEAFDEQIRDRFLPVYKMARDGQCDDWKQDADGCLALCLVLGEFPRYMFRESVEFFATDDKALAIAKFAILHGYDQTMPVRRRRFIYMPYQYSENLQDQNQSFELAYYVSDKDPGLYEGAKINKDIIERFGRFPQRNKIRGLESTPEEKAYLALPWVSSWI